MKKKVLVIDDDPLFRRSVENSLGRKFEVQSAESALQAEDRLKTERFPDLILLDITLEDVDGIVVLEKLKAQYPDLPVIMTTAVDRVQTIVRCMKLGASDYVTKPVLFDELLLVVERALETVEMRRDLERYRELEASRNREHRMRGSSPALEEIRRVIRKIAATDTTVLLVGETGTGKEVVAREIHSLSSRSRGPFVAVNCGAIPRELVEEEFFGHRRGAFTGAYEKGLGKFQMAHGGTLLLDEISELPMEAQSRLLRVLSEREFYQVGGTELIRVDIRVIACTNKNLEERVQAGEFREDLFYRLNVCRIDVPPLRERREDILDLAQYFVDQFSRKFGKNVTEISPEARILLTSQPWKGNVRELQNLLERVMLFQENSVIRPLDLGLARTEPPNEVLRIPPEGIGFDEVEKQLLIKAMDQAAGNRAAAARLLRMSPPTFYYRLKKHRLV